MSRYSDEQNSWSGSGDSLVLMILWFTTIFLLYWITGLLRIPYRVVLFSWGCLNFLPVLWLAIKGYPEILPIFGLLVVAGFSFVLGKSVFEARESEQQKNEE
jgi:hypothetical protein